jgi:hypothetical protein
MVSIICRIQPESEISLLLEVHIHPLTDVWDLSMAYHGAEAGDVRLATECIEQGVSR